MLQYSQGPCEQVVHDFYPNPVTDIMILTVTTKYESNVNLYIFDFSGNVYYYRYLPNVLSEYLTIPMNGFEKGLYIIMTEANGETYLSKFVRLER